MAFSLLAFKSDTLASDITDSANSMTLTTGSFGTPTGEQMLVIDYDIAAKREIVKCTIDGTAVTSIDRAQDGTAAVAHTSGAKVIMAFVPSHYTGLTDGTALTAGAITDTKLATKVKAGWDLLSATGTRASATQFTVTGDITDRLWVGKPVEFTDTTTKYGNIISFSYSSPNTTVNLAANTEYALVGNPTNIYGGLHSSPVGFPGSFATTVETYGSAGSKGAYAQDLDTTRFFIEGRKLTLIGGHRITNVGSWSGDVRQQLPVAPAATNPRFLCIGSITAQGANPGSAKAAIILDGSTAFAGVTATIYTAGYQWTSISANDSVLLYGSYYI